MIFLLPPLDSASKLLPPKVKEGAEPTMEPVDGVPALLSGTSSSLALARRFAAGAISLTSRAGAGALAAPLVGVVGDPAKTDLASPRPAKISEGRIGASGFGARSEER